MPKQSFADLGVSPVVVRALAARGVDVPFAVQRTVVPDVLAGRDVLVRSPTGSGKTLAFGVPIVDRVQADDARCAALVLVPTRELASQVAGELRDLAHARALSVATVYGGAGIEKQSRLARNAHVIVATPGRLEDLIGRGAVRLERVRVLVLDEADRMLDMGFRPAVERIVALTPASRQTLFLSATLDGDTGHLARTHTRDARRHDHEPAPSARAAIEHRFVAVGAGDRVDSLVRQLGAGDRGRTLVFVRTKRGADRLVKRLRPHGIDAAAIHGDRSQPQRERALARFHSGAVPTLVATDVAARGIDVDDVTHVINFDAPDSRDAYVHRSGRTGRAGASGVAITFVTHDTRDEVAGIAADLRLHAEFAAAGGRTLERGRAREQGATSPKTRSARCRNRRSRTRTTT